MVDMPEENRLDVRKALVGGVLAWIIQALVIFLHHQA